MPLPSLASSRQERTCNTRNGVNSKDSRVALKGYRGYRGIVRNLVSFLSVPHGYPTHL